MELSPFQRRRLEKKRGYVDYQARIAEAHLLPTLRRWKVRLDLPILDVGCGTGGCALALAAALGVRVRGIDLDRERIERARQEAATRGLEVHFERLDILTDRLPAGEFGLVLLRDVVEHLADVTAGLSRLRRSLAPAGALYVTFPPWRGPYAGHQHNARSFLRFAPYLHAIAPALFVRGLERFESDRTGWLADERQIVANRLTIARFEAAVAASGWRVERRRTYLLRPAFARMGLPTIGNGPLGRVPLLGEVLTTGCEYLLRLEEPLATEEGR